MSILPVNRLNRRRALMIIAGTSAAGTLGLAGIRQSKAQATYKWQGTALGADASMIFTGADKRTARQGLQIALDEIARLESIFSLYRQDSEIRRLNKTGALQPASMEMRQLLGLSDKISRASNGLFDPSVQVTLETVARWVETHPSTNHIPASLIEQARTLIDFRKIKTYASGVRLAHGQKITLNGIAQGFIADKIADLLRANGFDHVLVNTGEHHAIGAKPDGSAFIAQLAGSAMTVELDNTSLAVSSPTQVKLLDRGEGFSHLVDPATGKNRQYWKQLAVRHRSAAIADGLSTALCNCDYQTAKTVLNKFPNTTAWLIDKKDAVLQYQT